MGNAFLEFLKVFIGVSEGKTQTSELERACLIKYAAKAKYAVEIGVFHGVNTAAISLELQLGGLLFGVDPFIKGSFGISWNKMITLVNLKRRGNKERVHLIETFSADAIPFISATPDFIFIDGDHSWNGISLDWAWYSQLLKPEGIIALHDTSVPAHEPWKATMDSVRFFEQVIAKDQKFHILETVDSLNILQKCR